MNFFIYDQSSKTMSPGDIEIITNGIIKMKEDSFKPKWLVYFLKITFLFIENEELKKMIKSVWFTAIYPYEAITKYLRPAFGENTDMIALYIMWKITLKLLVILKEERKKEDSLSLGCVILFEAFFIS